MFYGSLGSFSEATYPSCLFTTTVPTAVPSQKPTMQPKTVTKTKKASKDVKGGFKLLDPSVSTTALQTHTNSPSRNPTRKSSMRPTDKAVMTTKAKTFS